MATLDNAALLGLLKNAAVLKAFPALKNMSNRLKTDVRGCGKCGRGRAKIKDTVANDIKRTLSGWPNSKKAKLKKLLGTDKIRLVVNKKVIEL